MNLRGKIPATGSVSTHSRNRPNTLVLTWKAAFPPNVWNAKWENDTKVADVYSTTFCHPSIGIPSTAEQTKWVRILNTFWQPDESFSSSSLSSNVWSPGETEVLRLLLWKTVMKENISSDVCCSAGPVKYFLISHRYSRSLAEMEEYFALKGRRPQ